MSKPLWYKDAVIYQLHVKTFQDSEGDGVGDFGGLMQRLDYLAELGVTALWLMPFYPPASHTALIARDGREIPIEDSAAPIRDTGGAMTASAPAAGLISWPVAAHRLRARNVRNLLGVHTPNEHSHETGVGRFCFQ